MSRGLGRRRRNECRGVCLPPGRGRNNGKVLDPWALPSFPGPVTGTHPKQSSIRVELGVTPNVGDLKVQGFNSILPPRGLHPYPYPQSRGSLSTPLPNYFQVYTH